MLLKDYLALLYTREDLRDEVFVNIIRKRCFLLPNKSLTVPRKI